MSKIVDKSPVDCYRGQYEAGFITFNSIAKIFACSERTIQNYANKKSWDKNIAYKNRLLIAKLTLIDKINQYKEKFENGTFTIDYIVHTLKCNRAFVIQYIKNNKWDYSASIERKKKHAQTLSARFSSQRKKAKLLLEKYQNFRVEDLIYTIEGLPIIFTGIVNGKLSKKDTLYTKNTYRHAEIQKIEESCGIKSKAFKSNV